MHTTTLKREDGYLVQEAPRAKLEGYVTVEELLDQLLELPMDAEYFISMQGSKFHPIEVEGYVYLGIRGNAENNPLWVSTAANRRSTSARFGQVPNNHMGEGDLTEIPEAGTVRSLIKGLFGLELERSLGLRGSFYSGFEITTRWILKD